MKCDIILLIRKAGGLMVKKVRNLGLIFILAFMCFPVLTKAETLDEYIAQAEAKLQQERATTEKKEMTEAEKEEALAEKDKIQNEITQTKNDISSLENEIKNLEDSINKKDDEIKQIMTFVQVPEGEMSYLEYIFGAKDFTDFIYFGS